MQPTQTDPNGLAVRESRDADRARVMTMIATGQPLSAVLGVIAQHASLQIGWACSILPADATQGMGFEAAVPALPGAVVDALADCFAAAAKWVRQVDPTRPQRLVCPDLHAEPGCAALWPTARSAGQQAVWFELIVGSDGTPLGTFASFHPQRCVPLPEEIEFVINAVQLATIAIDRERSLQALRDSQALLASKSAALEATLERMEQGVMMVSPARIVEVCNRRAIELLELPPALMASRPSFAQVLEYQWSVNEFESTPERLRAFVRAGGILDQPQSYERTRGNGRVIEVRSVPIEGGGVLRTYTDVTELRRAEAERVALESQLLEARKLEAIGTLAGGIAHDFNNIMAAILGNAALAGQDVGPDHSAQAYIAQISKAGRRARSLVQQILAFSRHQQSEPVSVVLNPLVEETAAMLEATLGPAVRLRLNLPPTRLAVMGEATQLQQVLMNLGTNAAQALGPGAGRIEIGLDALELEPDGDEAQRPHPELAPGDYAVLWVRDDGGGMDEETRRRIFEPFFTTKAPGAGTGLGLAVVHGIVKAMDGQITVDSAPGRGSTFRVYLRLVNHESRLMDLDPLEADPPGGQGQHVLYVDDDEVMAQLVQSLLQRLGYRCTSRPGAAEALAFLDGRSDDVELVVTDYTMPGISGLELARTLAERRPALPVVITSGYVSESLCAQAGACGVRAVMQKERTLEELASVVHRALSGRAPGTAAGVRAR